MNRLMSKAKGLRNVTVLAACVMGVLSTSALAETKCNRKTMAGDWLMSYDESATCEVKFRGNGKIFGKCFDAAFGSFIEFSVKGTYSIMSSCKLKVNAEFKDPPFFLGTIDAIYNGRATGANGEPDMAIVIRNRARPGSLQELPGVLNLVRE